MLLQIKSLLDRDQVRAIVEMMEAAPFARAAAGRPDPRALAHGLQVDRQQVPGLDRLDAMVIGAFSRHPLVRAALLPKAILTPIYGRHEPGHDSGFHTDVPLIGQPKQVRTDATATVFLSDPESYEGGELVLRPVGGETRLKLAAGDAVAFPTGVLHRVAPVRVGVRLAAVTWVQCLIADAARREILRDIEAAARLLNGKAPDGDAQRLAVKAYGNLFRMWAEV
jgi:PKHD-type hydroxylase